MKRIEQIELVFENCEVITFPGNVIGNINLENFKTIIRRLAVNSIDKYQSVETVAIEIFKDGNKYYMPFDIEELAMYKFERIMQTNDITMIYITYEDETKEEYLVNYKEEHENSIGSPNVYQKTLISDYGNIYIVIDKEKNIEDFFDLTLINDIKEMDKIHSAYDIGIEKEIVHSLEQGSLPKLYTYVYLKNSKTTKLAIRVCDKNNNSFFIYENADADFYPNEWFYPTSKVTKFLKKEYKDTSFDLNNIKDKYYV